MMAMAEAVSAGHGELKRDALTRLHTLDWLSSQDKARLIVRFASDIDICEAFIAVHDTHQDVSIMQDVLNDWMGNSLRAQRR